MEDTAQQSQKQFRSPAEIKEIRKTMTTIIRGMTHMKNSPFPEIKEQAINLLRSQDRDIVELLDEDNNTLAHLCVKESKLELIKAIISSYEDILSKGEKFFKWLMQENSEDLTIYDLASQKGNKDILKYLFEIVHSHETTTINITQHRNNIFHNAAKNNQCFPIIYFFERLQKLHPKQLILDITNQYGITPLHYACFHGSKKAMDLLIDLGANINGVDQEGNTPLHFAVQSGSERSVKKLLVRGSDKFIKNAEGNTPYDVAVKNNNKEMAKLLYHKNFFQRFFSSKNEIGAVKGGRNNLMLLFIVLCLIFVKMLYGYKVVNAVTDQKWRGQIMPYIPNIVYELNMTNEEGKNVTVKNLTVPIFKLEELVKCYSGKKCILEVTITVISFISDVVNLIVILYFLCFARRVYVQKKSKKQVKSLSKLFEEGKSVCVKCRMCIESDTMHCLVCNACVNNWDHHCFWLNTCISKENKRGFNFFFYIMFAFTTANMIMFLYNLILTPKAETNFIKLLLLLADSENPEVPSTIIPDNDKRIIIGYVLWVALNGGMFLFTAYSLFFTIIPIMKDNCRAEADVGQTLSQYQQKLISKNLNESGSSGSNYSL